MSKLNELLSIMISKLNASVKTEAQSFSEEEKAQVRANIGAEDIGYTETVKKTITWDGNTDGRTSITSASGDVMYKVSDTPIKITQDNLKRVDLGGTSLQGEKFVVQSQTLDTGATMTVVVFGYDQVILTADDDISIEDAFTIEKGMYFMKHNETGGYVSLLEIEEEVIHKVDPKYLPTNGFGYTEQTDNVIFESTLEFISEHEDNPGVASSEYIDLKAGEKYIVYFDGVEYECEGFAFAEPGTSIICLGNAGLAFGDPESMTDEPFIIAAVSSAEYAGCEFMLIDPSTFEPIIGEHTFKIIHKANVVHKIDPMFFDQLGWKQEKYVPVVNMPMYFGEGQFSNIYPAPFLEEGEIYRVTYSGYTYELKAKSASINGMSGIYIGDLGFVDFTPTTYPFVIGQYHEDVESWYMVVYAVDPDAFPNEIIPLEDVHQVKVEHKKKIIQKIDPDLYERLAWEDKIVKEIIPEMAVTDYLEREELFGLIVGGEYNVIFDGVEYKLTASSFEEDAVSAIILGNGSLLDVGEDNSLPFVIVDASSAGMTEAILVCMDDTVDHTISVTGTVVDVHKIDEKFLPEFPLNRTINTVNIDLTSTEALEFNGLITHESVMHIVIGGAKYDLPIVGSFGLQNISDVRTAVYVAGNKDLVEDALSQVGISLEGAPYFDVPLACFSVGYEKDGKTYISDFMLLPQESAADVDSVSLDIVKYDRLDVAYLSPTNIMWDLNRDLPGTYSTDFENAYRCLQAGLTVRSTLDGEPVEIVQIEQSTPFAYITVRNNLGEYYKVTIQCVSNTKQVTKLSPDDFILPSTVPNITSATENQMVVVEAVDESGKPISWKAVDVPEPVEYDVVQADYEQNDPSAPDYIKNRPVYTGTVIKCISWDGDSTDKFTDYWSTHVSDIFMEECPKINRIVLTNGQVETIARITSRAVGKSFWSCNVEISTSDGIEKINHAVQCRYNHDDGETDEPLGIYFQRQTDFCSWWVSKFEYLEEGVQKLDEKYLPDCVASEDYVNARIDALAITATSDMTEKVGINAEGQLVTKPIGGGIVDHILMRDAENGFTYIIEMRGGNLVSSAMYSGIRVAKLPDKLDYVEGDAIDVTGMIVECVREDGSADIISDYTYSEIAPIDGVISVSWTFMGFSFATSFNVNITSLDDYMVDLLVDFKYTKFDYGGTYVVQDWKGTLNGEASTEIVIPDHKNIQL